MEKWIIWSCLILNAQRTMNYPSCFYTTNNGSRISRNPSWQMLPFIQQYFFPWKFTTPRNPDTNHSILMCLAYTNFFKGYSLVTCKKNFQHTDFEETKTKTVFKFCASH